MAKGKITEYDVGSFSPSAVGVPGEDRSGQIIASGLVNVGKALTERADTSDTLSAQVKFGDFQFNYQQTKFALQNQYRDEPEKFTAAMKLEADKLSDVMGKGMSGGSFAKFKSLTNSAVASDADNNLKWAFNRDNEIQVGKITTAKQNVALKGNLVSGPDGLAEIYNDFTELSKTSTKFITSEADTKLTEEYRKLAVKYAMNAQLLSRPYSLKIDLEGGAYKDLLTADDIQEYSTKAQTAVLNKTIDDQYRGVFMEAGKIQEFKTGLDDGSKSLVDLITEREAVYANRKRVDDLGRPIVSPGYINSLDAMIGAITQSRQRSYVGKQEREASKASFDRKWDEFFQVKKSDTEGPKPADLEKELELYTDLHNDYASGIIDKNDFDEKVALMNTKHKLQGRSVYGPMPMGQAMDQSGTKPGWFGLGKVNDIASIGYSMIKDHVEKSYPELPIEERRDLKTQMMAKYHQTIQSTPPTMMDGMKNEQDRTNFAHRAIFGAATEKGETVPGITTSSASYKGFRIGDTTVDRIGGVRIFNGKDSNGRPIWKLTAASEGKIHSYNNRNFLATGINPDTGEIMWEEVTNAQ